MERISNLYNKIKGGQYITIKSSRIKPLPIYNGTCSGKPHLSSQGGLNKKQKKLNLCKIFSILIFNELFIRLMILNCVKLGRTVSYFYEISS